MDGECLATACCDFSGADPQILMMDFVMASSERAHAHELADVVRRHGIAGVRCQWLIPSDQYQIVQIDAPDVPESERMDAARWRIRELVRIPLNEAVVDGFLVPNERAGGAPDKLYMVASPRAETEQAAMMASTAGLRLDMLGIPELALRNLAALHSGQRGGVAMLAVSERDALLTISRGETLYLCRWLEGGVDDFSGDALEHMALEVQRSLDFYESQVSGSPVSRVVVVPRGVPDAAGIASRLDEQLGLPVEALVLGELLDLPQPLSAELQAHCALAVGAALEPAA